MKYLLFIMIPVSTFTVFSLGMRFIEFCDLHSDAWWGGFPLWMTGGICVLFPLLIAGIVLPIWLVLR